MSFIFCTRRKTTLIIEILETQKKKKKEANTQMYNNLSFLKGFMRFFIGGLCRLALEAEYLDGL
jgi:hypothetical protein